MSEIKTLYGNPLVDSGARQSIERVNEKTALVVGEKTVYTGNLINGSLIQYDKTKYSNWIEIDHPGDGDYYVNPYVSGTAQIRCTFLDENGNNITITNSNDETVEYVTPAYNRATFVFEGQTLSIIDVRADGMVLSPKVYTLSEVPTKWKIRSWAHSESVLPEWGFTVGEPFEEYVPYVAPVTRYVYSQALDEHIENVAGMSDSESAEGDYSIPARKLGVLERTYNLLDESKINWEAQNGYYRCESGYYIPVIAGKSINTNLPRMITFYDDNGNSVGTGNNVLNYIPVTVPEGATKMSIMWNVNRVTQYSDIVVYYQDEERLQSVSYDRRPYVPYSKFVPMYAGNDIYDYAKPSDLTKGVIKMARVAAIRAANERQHAYRFGTFNVWVSRTNTHFAEIADMLTDYGIDFCGFQEFQYSAKDIGSYIPEWLMPYNTGDRNTELPAYYNNLNNNTASYDGVGAVSRFEIISAELVALSSEARFVKVIKLRLPKAGSYNGSPTLTVFNYHSSLVKATRDAEAQAMLNLVAEDDSDFQIIMGDTNCGYGWASGMSGDLLDHTAWDMYEAAGFTAVNKVKPTFSPQHENQYRVIDSIFFGPNISLIDFEVVDTRNYPVGNNLPLSDHHFLYADLAFDFDAVYGAPWASESEPT